MTQKHSIDLLKTLKGGHDQFIAQKLALRKFGGRWESDRNHGSVGVVLLDVGRLEGYIVLTTCSDRQT